MKVKILRCYGCGGCVAICPVDAITINDEKARIDFEKCIKCLLCEKVCPLGLIDIEKLSKKRENEG